MTVALTTNELQFKNAALTKATNAIIKARNSAVSSYLTIGEKLKEIRDSKLYKEDFSKFEDFTNEVFGLSKQTAYRMIAVTTRFLIPEKTVTADKKFFSDFEDSALGALLNAPLAIPENSSSTDVYDATIEFCEDHYIDTTTPVSEIRQIIKDAKKSESTNVETEVDVEVETAETEKDLPETKEPQILKLTDVQASGVMNTINAITTFIERVTSDVRNGVISEKDFGALSDIYKVISKG